MGKRADRPGSLKGRGSKVAQEMKNIAMIQVMKEILVIKKQGQETTPKISR